MEEEGAPKDDIESEVSERKRPMIQRDDKSELIMMGGDDKRRGKTQVIENLRAFKDRVKDVESVHELISYETFIDLMIEHEAKK